MTIFDTAVFEIRNVSANCRNDNPVAKYLHTNSKKSIIF